MKLKTKKSAGPKLYKIETGIKVPPVVQGVSSVAVGAVAATMERLAAGQSFLIKDELEAIKAALTYRGFRQRESERGGAREFTSRKAGKGLRIWRLK